MAFMAKAARSDEANADQAGTAEGASTASGSAAGMLAMAQKLHEQYVAEGQAKHDVLIAEADAMVAQATAEHQRLLAEARERSAGMVSEAEKVRAEVLQALGRDRTALQEEIEDLRTFERAHRAPLKSYIEDRLIELEQTGVDETG